MQQHKEKRSIYSDSVENLWKSGSEEEWKAALNHYYEMLDEKQMVLDEYIRNVDSEKIKGLSPEEFYTFLYEKYFVWKYTQKNRLATTRKLLMKYIDEDCMNELEKIHRDIFSAERNDIGLCLGIARKIKGLGTAGASGLLSVLFSECFGTVDQFVVKALLGANDEKYKDELLKINPGAINQKQGIFLIEILREKASELNFRFNTRFWTPRKIDMVLWSIRRER